jgi:hypothetical protein
MIRWVSRFHDIHCPLILFSSHAAEPQHIVQTRRGEERLIPMTHMVVHLDAKKNQNTIMTTHVTSTNLATPINYHCHMTAYLDHVNQPTQNSNASSTIPH